MHRDININIQFSRRALVSRRERLGRPIPRTGAGFRQSGAYSSYINIRVQAISTLNHDNLPIWRAAAVVGRSDSRIRGIRSFLAHFEKHHQGGGLPQVFFGPGGPWAAQSRRWWAGGLVLVLGGGGGGGGGLGFSRFLLQSWSAGVIPRRPRLGSTACWACWLLADASLRLRCCSALLCAACWLGPTLPARGPRLPRLPTLRYLLYKVARAFSPVPLTRSLAHSLTRSYPPLPSPTLLKLPATTGHWEHRERLPSVAWLHSTFHLTSPRHPRLLSQLLLLPFLLLEHQHQHQHTHTLFSPYRHALLLLRRSVLAGPSLRITHYPFGSQAHAPHCSSNSTRLCLCFDPAPNCDSESSPCPLVTPDAIELPTGCARIAKLSSSLQTNICVCQLLLLDNRAAHCGGQKQRPRPRLHLRATSTPPALPCNRETVAIADFCEHKIRFLYGGAPSLFLPSAILHSPAAHVTSTPWRESG